MPSLLLQAAWLNTAILETLVSSTYIKTFKSQNYLVNFDKNCKICSKEVLVNQTNGVVNAD